MQGIYIFFNIRSIILYFMKRPNQIESRELPHLRGGVAEFVIKLASLETAPMQRRIKTIFDISVYYT